MEILQSPGVYLIVNTANGEKYVGSSTDVYTRIAKHRSLLNQGTHHNPKIQQAWKEFGGICFEFSVLEYCDKKDLEEREQVYIAEIKPTYNILQEAYSTKGLRHTTEARAKVSRARSGVSISGEHKAKISRSRRGKTTKHVTITSIVRKDKTNDV